MEHSTGLSDDDGSSCKLSESTGDESVTHVGTNVMEEESEEVSRTA